MKLSVTLNFTDFPFLYFLRYESDFIINHICIFKQKENQHIFVKSLFLNFVFLKLLNERWLAVTQTENDSEPQGRYISVMACYV